MLLSSVTAQTPLHLKHPPPMLWLKRTLHGKVVVLLFVLLLQALGVDDVTGFDFMDPPPRAAVIRCVAAVWEEGGRTACSTCWMTLCCKVSN